MTEEPQAGLPNASDIMERYAAYEARAAELHPANKLILFAALRDAGIAKVTVRFEGYADSGQIEEILAASADEVTCEVPPTPVTIRKLAFGEAEPHTITEPLGDAIGALCYALLGDSHCGWEINEGAFGDFTFDVDAGMITLDYNQRVETSEYSQHVF